MQINQINFLLVEDDASASIIATEALQEGWAMRGVEASVTCCANGEEAIHYLELTTELPDLIITDIRMPRMDGNRMIQLLKASPLLRGIPIVVLSTSDDEDDKRRAYMGGCSGYFVKAADYEKFMGDLQIITDYWTISKLPESYL